MQKGLEYQFALIKKLAEQNKVEVMTLGESGRWFLSQYVMTPSGSLTALSDWHDAGHKSIWYYSRHYRVNLFWEKGEVRIRDMYIFDDTYEEKYIQERCKTHACEFRNLPIMDGVLYTNSESARAAGIYFKAGEEILKWDNLNYLEEEGCSEVHLTAGNHRAIIYLSETKMEVVSNIAELKLEAVYDEQKVFGMNRDEESRFTNANNNSTVITYVTEVDIQENQMKFVFDGQEYGLLAEKGHFEGTSLCSDNGSISIKVVQGGTNGTV